MLTPSLCRHAESLHVNHSLSSTLSPLSAHQSYKPTEIASKVKSIVLLKKFKILDVLPHTANPHQTTLIQPAESTMVSLLHHKHRITMQWNNMGTGNSLHTNLTSPTPLFKGSDVPTKVGRTFTGTQEQFWLNAFPATTRGSYGYQRELNLFCCVQVHRLNQRATAALLLNNSFLQNVYKITILTQQKNNTHYDQC